MPETNPTISYLPGPNGEAPAIFTHHSAQGAAAPRCPIARVPLTGAEVRIITDRDDVIQVLSDRGNFGVADVDTDYALTGAPFQEENGLLRMDPPDITAVRRVMGKHVSGNTVKRYRGPVEGVATKFVDRLLQRQSSGRRTVELGPFCNQFVAETAATTTGFPIRRWGILSSISAVTLGITRTDADFIRMSWQDLYDMTDGIIEDKRRNPDGLMIANMIPDLEQEGITGDRLTQAMASFLNGLTTPVGVMTVCMTELLKRPRTVNACLKDPSKWRPTVDELLRYRAHFAFAVPRIALQDVKLADETIQRGEVVVPSLTGALHDPAHAQRPDKFDPEQKAKRNLAFGNGPHLCPAAALSRDWLEIGLKEMFTSLPGLRLRILERELEWTEGSLPTPISLPATWGKRKPFEGLLRLFEE